jgi:hypothetical protein
LTRCRKPMLVGRTTVGMDESRKTEFQLQLFALLCRGLSRSCATSTQIHSIQGSGGQSAPPAGSRRGWVENGVVRMALASRQSGRPRLPHAIRKLANPCLPSKQQRNSIPVGDKIRIPAGCPSRVSLSTSPAIFNLLMTRVPMLPSRGYHSVHRIRMNVDYKVVALH